MKSKTDEVDLLDGLEIDEKKKLETLGNPKDKLFLTKRREYSITTILIRLFEQEKAQ